LGLELQKKIGEEFYKGKELEMRGKEFDQRDRELQENRKQREQDFQQTHQLKIDELDEKAETARQAAFDRKTSEQDRVQNWGMMNQMRQESIGISKQLADARIAALSATNTPKERQTEWKNLMDDLDKRRVADFQNMTTFNKQGVIKSLMPGGPNKEQLQDSIDRSNAAKTLALRVQSDVISGKMDPQQAKDKIYSVYDPSTKLAKMTDVQAYAKKKGVSADQAQKEFESTGYVVY
jgi:hypothetical protein